jgi:hypothetical protein
VATLPAFRAHRQTDGLSCGVCFVDLIATRSPAY